MNQKHKDQISPKMQTNLKISRKGSLAKDVPWISPNPEYLKCILRGLTNPNCDYIFPSLTSLSLRLRSQWLKMGEKVFINFLWWLFVTLLSSQCGNWNLALKSLFLLPLFHAPHASFCNHFPRFVPSAPSPHHISPRRVPAPSSVMQRTQPPHTQPPAGGPHLKSYQPETNSSFQPNGIHVHGKWGSWAPLESGRVIPGHRCQTGAFITSGGFLQFCHMPGFGF